MDIRFSGLPVSFHKDGMWFALLLRKTADPFCLKLKGDF
jgi:hypothetical protein